MDINRANAMRLWEECYGDQLYAKDFHGNLMYKYDYGKNHHVLNYVNACTNTCSEKHRIPALSNTYAIKNNCGGYGWNIHHILPLALGGTNEKSNLCCTNIKTNEEAADKITFWIGDSLYQVKRIQGISRHEIIRIK